MTRLIDADALVFSRVRIAHEDGTIGGYNAVVMSSEIKNAPTIEPSGLTGWICPICGKGLSPFTSVCPCQGGKGWEITCG